MRRGQQKAVPAARYNQQYHPQQRQRLIGAYNWHTNQVTTQRVDRVDGEHFAAFLESLLTEVYPHQVVLLVLDNASVHKTAAVQATLSVFEHRVQAIFLPPYCPELNPIERFWRHLKDLVYANRLFPNLASLVAALDHVLALQNQPHSPLRFRLSNDFQ